MIQFADFEVNGKMTARSGKLMVQVLFLLLLTDLAFSEANSRTPARILAKQTGAAQFEEHIEQPTHNDCNEHHHRLRKRSSDEDLDYEVYQGVVGRPGIDFPIFPRIPQTTFSCRSYGNGYFADLETGCQVFHICEEGRKISFLCPNGTIFQQSELTCDWWFKVNCAGSPSFYLESSEILSKARRQRVKSNKGFKNNNKVAEVIPSGKAYKGSERRIDSNENPSVESVDFEDISDDRSRDGSNDRSNDRLNDRSNGRSNYRSNDRSNGRTKSRFNGSNARSNNRSNDKLKSEKQKLLTDPPSEDNQEHRHNEPELQITAETGSFVKDPRQNSFIGDDKTLNKGREFSSDKLSDKPRDVEAAKIQNIGRNNQRNDFNDKPKTGKKIDDEKPTDFYITARPDISNPSTTGKASYYTTAQPEVYTNRNSLDGPTSGDKLFVTHETGDRNLQGSYSTLKPEFFANGPILKSATTPSSYPGTYSTARRLDSTRTTPFYTPTVPSVSRAKPTESKTYFVNVKTDESATLRGPITTEYATPRPIILGMRHDNSDIHRFPVFSNGDLKVQLPVYSVQSLTPAGLSVTTSTSGPTYLPNGTKINKIGSVTPANIDSSVARNVKGILQTVGMIKDTMKVSLDDKTNTPRIGLDIPPSSGPGTLVSLTNYFANGDQTTTTVSSEEDKLTTPSVDIAVGLLSNKTSEKYLSLFGLDQNDDSNVEHDNAATGTTASPKIVQTPTVIADFTKTTIRDLAQNPETRKIAQVFSNAITKYIENPDTFRKGLIEVRPTEPTRKLSSGTASPYTTPISYFKGGTVTTVTDDNSFSKDQTQAYLSTTTEKYDTSTNPTTESNDIAKEINDQFDVSTPVYDSVSTESTEATTYRGSRFSTSKPSTDTSVSSELLPPSHDEEHEHETLHKVQSQSFVKSYNDLAKVQKSVSFDKSKNTFDTSAEKATTIGNPWLQGRKDNLPRTDGPWTQSPTNSDTTTVQNHRDSEKLTESPWAHPVNAENKNRIDTSTAKVTGAPGNQTPWQYEGKGTFDDSNGVVSITESILGKKSQSTEYPWTHSAISQTPSKTDTSTEKVVSKGNPWLGNKQPKVKPTENPWSQITQSIYLDPLTINDGLMREQKTTTLSPFEYVNTDRSRFEDASQSEEGIDDILNSPELSSEILPSDNGLQRIANKLFGGLNETEALHLQNVMKKAEHNQSVLKLLLLLIQTCDDQNGKALEKSRKILLNALIGMDGKPKLNKNIAQVSSTTNKIPVTTYRGVYSGSTSTVASPTTTLPSSEETTKFEIRVPELEEEDNSTNTSTSKAISSERQPKGYDNPNRTSDERALELLKSLYSLASKFSRR